MNDGWDNASDNVKQAYGRACVDETLKVSICVYKVRQPGYYSDYK